MILLQNLQDKVRSNYVPFEEQFEKIAAGPADQFPDFSFIEARYYGINQNDDHPPHNVMKGQKLIADVYNKIRKNPELWKSTLLVVLHDEHGGFYDHVTPPMGAIPPRAKMDGDEYDFTQFGVRVPALLVSPWVAHGTEKIQFDHTSLLKYLKTKWGLGDLGDRVVSDQTNCISKALNFSIPMRMDTIEEIKITEDHLTSPHPDWELSATSHHYALDLLQQVIFDDAGGQIVRELSDKSQTEGSAKTILIKAGIILLIKSVMDLFRGIYESFEAKKLRKDVIQSKRAVSLREFLEKGGNK